MEAFHGWRSSGDDEDDDKEARLTELVDDSSTSNQGYALLRRSGTAHEFGLANWVR